MAEDQHGEALEAKTGKMHIFFPEWTGVAGIPKYDEYSAMTQNTELWYLKNVDACQIKNTHS